MVPEETHSGIISGSKIQGLAEPIVSTL